MDKDMAVDDDPDLDPRKEGDDVAEGEEGGDDVGPEVHSVAVDEEGVAEGDEGGACHEAKSSH